VICNWHNWSGCFGHNELKYAVNLAVLSHKLCWRDWRVPSRVATDGGFPFQIGAIADLFDETIVAVPVGSSARAGGEHPLTGPRLRVLPLGTARGRPGVQRKLALAPWTMRNAGRLVRALRWADGVHVPIPSDIGTLAMLLARKMRKPLFVRFCGDWARQWTVAERYWRRALESWAGGSTVVLVTGMDSSPPSQINPALRWIFSTTLTSSDIDSAYRPRTAPSGRGIRLATACRLEPRKGVDVAIRTLGALAERQVEATLDVVGDGSEASALMTLAESLGLARHVRFHGRRDREGVLGHLRQADIFCYPTGASEGFPKVVLEAMACGTPVVATRVSAISGMLSEGGGLLLKDTNPAAVADMVLCAVGDREGYETMSRCAAETARRFTLERWQAEIAAHLTAAWGTLRCGGKR